MVKMRPNARQIINALECCRGDLIICPNCAYFKHKYDDIGCHKRVANDALSLIKELTVKLDAMSGEANSYKKKNKDFAEEIKRLEASVEANRFIALEALGGIAYGINEKNRDCETERFVMAEVVKEVESRLKEYFTCDNKDRYSGKAVWDAIEQVSEQLRSIGWTGWKSLKK